jgi:pyrroline-5-carboxylate reductase
MRIGLIGAGRMAMALAGGIVRSGLAREEDLVVSSREEGASRGAFGESFPLARWSPDLAQVADESDLVILAIKPQVAPAILPAMSSATAGKLVVSVMTGIPLARLAEMLHPSARIIRTMPNTPIMVGEGAAAYSCGPGVTPDDEAWVHRLLESGGKAWKVGESQLDAVTAVSGSGPAYVFHFLEAMIAGGVEEGLSAELAQALAVQTIIGAGRMVEKTGEAPLDLAAKVKSPGGTTLAACQALEDGHFRETVIRAIAAARRRAEELSK